jgi:hypothetical protein
MNPLSFISGRMVSAFLLAMMIASDGLAQVQIVNCDAPVQSRKRGLAVNTLSPADFQVLAPGVSWFYDWGVNNWTVPSGVAMSYIPMVWNGSSGFQTALTSYLAAGNRPWRVFTLNEPNFTTQANMTPESSAATFQQVSAICAPYKIPVVGPHMAIGTPANQSITAYDPIENSNVTYTYQEPYLDAFQYYCGTNEPVGMSTHSYGGYGEITWITGTMRTDFPTQTVWLTEFNPSSIGTSASTVLANLIPSVDYCERTPWIEGYSWFMSRITGDTNDSILTTSSGILTPAGQAYVQMPVHQTNIFYLIPGRLQAERYITETNMNIIPTTDTNGLADMQSAAAGSTLDYQLQVNSAGNYPLHFRMTGPVGQISVYEKGVLLGAVTPSTTSWSSPSLTVSLPAGLQTLHVVFAANSQEINWIDFLATNGTPSVPDGLTASPGNLQVGLGWMISAGAVSYNVKQANNSNGPFTTIGSTTSTTFTNTGLANGASYYYAVSAVNTSGESSNSLVVYAVPAAPLTNLALNKPVYVSSTQSGYPASNAVDGDVTTRWGSAFSDPQWIYVDLQNTYNLSEVDLYWENAYATAFQIQVSPDATNWTTIYSTTTGPGGTQYLTGLSGTGRYVRMYGTTRATVYGYSLYEFQVFGTPANLPPVLAAIPNQSILAGQTLLVTNSASDPNVPPLPLSFSLPQAPAGASVGSSSGVFAWRPMISQSPSTQSVVVAVSDNSLPPLSATQSFNVIVAQPAAPTLKASTLGNGRFQFTINGNAGPDYLIQTSSNLTSWVTAFTNSSPSMPFIWVDTNSPVNPANFYRVLLGP